MTDANAEEVRSAARAAIDRLHHTLRAVAIGRPTAKAAASAAAASDAASGAGAATGRGGSGGSCGSFVVEQTARLRSAVLDGLGVDSWETLVPSRAALHAFAILSGPATPVDEILDAAADGRRAVRLLEHEGTLTTDAAAVADVALLSAVAVAVYGSVFDALLTAVLPLQEYMAYWTHLRRRPLAAYAELAQSAPVRAWQMGWSAWHDGVWWHAWQHPLPMLRAVATWNPLHSAWRRYHTHFLELEGARHRLAWGIGALAECTAALDGCRSPHELLGRVQHLLTVIASVIATMTVPPSSAAADADGTGAAAAAWLPTPAPTPSPPPLPVLPADLAAAAEALWCDLREFERRGAVLDDELAQLDALHRPPPQLQRLWLPAVMLTAGTYFGGQYLSAHRYELRDWLISGWVAARRFAVEYIVAPAVRMYQTIRYDQHDLAIIRRDALRADLESLERMVLAYVADRPAVLPDIVPNEVAGQVAAGDISVIMRSYEDGLRTPIKAIVFGDLVRLILIQVQKTKVDVETAMVALDRLLKANELNFTLLTMLPAVLLLVVLLRQARRLLAKRAHLAFDDVHSTIRAHLRLVEVLLNRNNVAEGRQRPLPTLDQGFLLMEVHILRGCCGQLADDDVELFLDDLRELEQAGLSVQQRLEVVQRLSRYFPSIVYGRQAHAWPLALR